MNYLDTSKDEAVRQAALTGLVAAGWIIANPDEIALVESGEGCTWLTQPGNGTWVVAGGAVTFFEDAGQQCPAHSGDEPQGE